MIQGRYQLLELLGSGAYGTVYLTKDVTLNRSVALKVSKPQDDTDFPTQREQFLREAQVLSKLKHPGICAVYDFFEEAGHLYLAMEYVPGESLQEWREGCTAPPCEATLEPILKDTLAVFQYLHRLEPPVVHRDVKPENFRRTPEGRLVLVDFGLARPRRAGQRDTQLVGTPGYAAPEQYTGFSQPASDLYAWGCVAWFLATGEHPQQVPPPFPPLHQRRPDLPATWQELLESCKAVQPAQRPAADKSLSVLLGQSSVKAPAQPTPSQPSTCFSCGSSATPRLLDCCPECLLSRSLGNLSSTAWAARGEELFRQSLFREAVAHLEEAGKRGDQSPQTQLLRAQALTKCRRGEDSLAVLSGLPDSPELIFEKALLLAALGKRDQALALLRTSDHPEARALYAYQGKKETALRNLWAKHRNYPRIAALLAQLLLSTNREVEADDILQEALTLHPERLELLRSRLNTSFARDDLEQCRIATRAILRGVPHDPLARLMRARLARRDGRIPAAVEDLEGLLQVHPDRFDAKLELCLTLEAAGHQREAIGKLQALLKEFPNKTRLLTPALARCFLGTRRYAEAVRCLEPLAPGSGDPELLALYALALQETGREEEAQERAQEAVELDPGQDLARRILRLEPLKKQGPIPRPAVSTGRPAKAAPPAKAARTTSLFPPGPAAPAPKTRTLPPATAAKVTAKTRTLNNREISVIDVLGVQTTFTLPLEPTEPERTLLSALIRFGRLSEKQLVGLAGSRRVGTMLAVFQSKLAKHGWSPVQEDGFGEEGRIYAFDAGGVRTDA